MLAAATFPAAMARITVAGPVTQSPPANTPSFSAIELSFSAKKHPRLAGMPARSNGSETIFCPIATITMSQGYVLVLSGICRRRTTAGDQSDNLRVSNHSSYLSFFYWFRLPEEHEVQESQHPLR